MNCERFRDDIDLYALGTLTPAEADAVRAHAATCDDCRAELLAAEAAAAQLAWSAPRVQAPAALRESVMRAVRAETPAPAVRRGAAARRLLAIGSRLRSRYGAIAAALVLVPLAGLALWSAQLQRQVNDLREETVELRQRNDGLLLMSIPSSLKADFVPVADLPGLAGAATWNPDRQVCFVFFDGLPRPDSGTTYRLWYVVDGARLVDAGPVLPDESGRAELVIDTSRWRGQEYEMTLKAEQRPSDRAAPALLIARLRRP